MLAGWIGVGGGCSERPRWWSRSRRRLDRDLWHRRLYLRPDVDGWTVWQFTGRGSVDGIGGDVDVNVMRPG